MKPKIIFPYTTERFKTLQGRRCLSASYFFRFLRTFPHVRIAIFRVFNANDRVKLTENTVRKTRDNFRREKKFFL